MASSGTASSGMAFSEAARTLSELGHPHRLLIFDYLVKAGEAGASVGEVQARLGIPKSTLSHHLAQLAGVGLLRQTREGRVLRCRIDPVRTRLVQHFINQCCEGLAPHGDNP